MKRFTLLLAATAFAVGTGSALADCPPGTSASNDTTGSIARGADASGGIAKDGTNVPLQNDTAGAAVQQGADGTTTTYGTGAAGGGDMAATGSGATSGTGSATGTTPGSGDMAASGSSSGGGNGPSSDLATSGQDAASQQTGGDTSAMAGLDQTECR